MPFVLTSHYLSIIVFVIFSSRLNHFIFLVYYGFFSPHFMVLIQYCYFFLTFKFQFPIQFVLLYFLIFHHVFLPVLGMTSITVLFFLGTCQLSLSETYLSSLSFLNYLPLITNSHLVYSLTILVTVFFPCVLPLFVLWNV